MTLKKQAPIKNERGNNVYRKNRKIKQYQKRSISEKGKGTISEQKKLSEKRNYLKKELYQKIKRNIIKKNYTHHKKKKAHFLV